jgi:hypothetical protein
VLETGGAGFASNLLGFAAYFKKTPVLLLSTEKETFLEKLESVAIAVPGYWGKHKA